jgi:hypothetical protein
VRASRVPWWFYAIAASFLCSFTLHVYNYIWGPEPLGFDLDLRTGATIVGGQFCTSQCRYNTRLRSGIGNPRLPSHGDLGRFNVARKVAFCQTPTDGTPRGYLTRCL